MTVTASMISKIRRMISEPTEATYTDEDIESLIDEYPVIDKDGKDPDETNWIPTYDLNAVAGDIWAEKASAISANFDFTADGATFNRSQVAKQYMDQARYYRSRRFMGTIRQIPTRGEVALDDLLSDGDEVLTG